MVFLVGDSAYDSRFGFRSVRPHNIALADNQAGDRLQVKMLGRPSMLPVYARLMPYEGSEEPELSLGDINISSHIRQEPWREHSI